MKPLKLIVIGMMLLFAGMMQAQVSINVNLGTVPPWGSRIQENVRYYYLPDVDAYYDLRTSMFIFSYNGNWIHRRHLPDMYRGYNLYEGRKIVMRDYDGDSPFTYYRNRNWTRENRMEQRANRDDYRYGDYNERRVADREWRRNDDRREFKHDNGHGHGHGQKRGWED